MEAESKNEIRNAVPDANGRGLKLNEHRKRSKYLVVDCTALRCDSAFRSICDPEKAELHRELIPRQCIIDFNTTTSLQKQDTYSSIFGTLCSSANEVIVVRVSAESNRD